MFIALCLSRVLFVVLYTHSAALKHAQLFTDTEARNSYIGNGPHLANFDFATTRLDQDKEHQRLGYHPILGDIRYDVQCF